MVSRACNRDPYGDVPDATSAGPLSDATCAQVASWLLMGIDPAMRGSDYVGAVKSSSMLGDQVTRDTTAVTQAMSDAIDCLCQESVDILLQAGLLYVAGPLFDACAVLPQWGTGTGPFPQWSPFANPLTGEVEFPVDGAWPWV